MYNAPKVEGICDRCGAPLIQREDDKPETVASRLNVYHEMTEPLENYYKESGVYVEVDGTQTMDEVFASILALLKD